MPLVVNTIYFIESIIESENSNILVNIVEKINFYRAVDRYCRDNNSNSSDLEIIKDICWNAERQNPIIFTILDLPTYQQFININSGDSNLIKSKWNDFVVEFNAKHASWKKNIMLISKQHKDKRSDNVPSVYMISSYHCIKLINKYKDTHDLGLIQTIREKCQLIDRHYHGKSSLEDVIAIKGLWYSPYSCIECKEINKGKNQYNKFCSACIDDIKSIYGFDIESDYNVLSDILHLPSYRNFIKNNNQINILWQEFINEFNNKYTITENNNDMYIQNNDTHYNQQIHDPKVSHLYMKQ